MSGSPALRSHWTRWGQGITTRLKSRLLPRSAYDIILTARDQAQYLAHQFDPEANIYLEGSIVTTGLLEKGSDLDLCCCVTKHGSVPEEKQQGKLSEKLYRRIKYSIPTSCKIQQIDMVRIPLVKYDAEDTPEIRRSTVTPLSGEREENARTAVLTFNFPLSTGQVDRLVGLMGPERIEEHSLSANPKGGSILTIRARSALDAMHCIGVLPDGQVISKSMKDQYTRGFVNRTDVPELLRFSFDITFLGYAVRNSYLIRKYLHDPNGPSTSRLCQMALKRWGKVTEVGVGAKGNLTSYAMTIMWIYYLLRTGQVGWFDPWSVPDALHLPQYPEYSPLPENVDYAEIGQQLYEFFNFYSKIDYNTEVISLSRPGITTRDMINWQERQREKFHFNLCIEDPYEDDLNCARRMNPKKMIWYQDLLQDAMATMREHPRTGLYKIVGDD